LPRLCPGGSCADRQGEARPARPPGDACGDVTEFVVHCASARDWLAGPGHPDLARLRRPVIATGILMLNDDILKPLLNVDLARRLLPYSLLADLFGLALVLAFAYGRQEA
jgi:hypothetical protein